MLTVFGKFTRKLRIDVGETLYSMAKKLGVSSAFLSAVEVGNKSIPKDWLELLSEKYNLSEIQKSELEEAIGVSGKVLKVDFSDKKLEDRELLWKLAKRIADIDPETKDRISDILKGE